MRNANKYDITVAGNSIGGRQGWAYIGNSGEVVVLKADLDKPQEYKEYQEFCNARVAWNYNNSESYKPCTLAHNSCYGEPYWELTSGGCGISAHFGYHDAMELINNAQMPIIKADSVVAIAKYTSKTVGVSLYKLGRVDIHCQTVAKLIPLNEEEMNEVVRKINVWLNR